MDIQQEQEILCLRTANLTPKQIAKKLQMTPAAVAAIIKERSQQEQAVKAGNQELPPIKECLINQGAWQILLGEDEVDIETKNNGFAMIIVSRQERFL